MPITIVERFRSPSFLRVYHLDQEIPEDVGRAIIQDIKAITQDIVGVVGDYVGVHIYHQSKWEDIEPYVIGIILRHMNWSEDTTDIVYPRAVQMSKSIYRSKINRRHLPQNGN